MTTTNIVKLTTALITPTILIVGVSVVDVGAQEAQTATKADIENLEEVIITKIDALDKRIDAIQWVGGGVAVVLIGVLYSINRRLGKLEGTKETEDKIIEVMKRELPQIQEKQILDIMQKKINKQATGNK